MDPRFPKLDPAGHVYSGAGTIWRDGIYVCDGYGPVPIGVDYIVYGRDIGEDIWEGHVHNVQTGVDVVLRPWRWNWIHGSDVGAWCGARSDGRAERYTRIMLERVFEGVSAPKLSRSAAQCAWLTTPQEVRKTLVVNDRTIVTDDIFDFSVSDLAICWDVARGKERHIYGRRHGDSVIHQWNIEPWEAGLLIDTPEGPWLLSTTQTSLILRPAGERRGYRFEGDCFEVDARWFANAIHIVGRRGADILHHVVYITDARVDLAMPLNVILLPINNPAETPITGPVDVLPYVIGDETDWPADSGNGGVMHCFWEQWGDNEGRVIFQKNVVTGKSFEVWEFGPKWVRHRRDRVNEPRGEYYEFSDGRWIPRYVTPAMVGTTVVRAYTNQIRFGHADGRVDEWTTFPYEMRIRICTQERLVFEANPAPGTGNYEIFECIRNRGWRRWWLVEEGTDRVLHSSEWMSNADPTLRKRPIGYVPDPREPYPALPEDSPVGVTIESPEFPVTGAAPLSVRCVAKILSGEATKLQWQRRPVGGKWQDEHPAPEYRPTWDLDHTFWFDKPGEYEIRLTAYGSNGSTNTTGKQRKVVVR